MSYVFANNVQTTLASAASSTATTLTLASSANLPALAAGQIMPITLNDAATGTIYEICYVTAISGATLTVNRAQEGTTAQNWSVGDYAFAAWTAGTVQGFLQIPYSISSGTNGQITASQYVMFFLADRAINVPANFSGSLAKVLTAFTNSAVYTIYHNGSSVGTISFAASGTTGTFSTSSAFTLAVGDSLTIEAPSTPDPTASTMAITIQATLA